MQEQSAPKILSFAKRAAAAFIGSAVILTLGIGLYVATYHVGAMSSAEASIGTKRLDTPAPRADAPHPTPVSSQTLHAVITAKPPEEQTTKPAIKIATGDPKGGALWCDSIAKRLSSVDRDKCLALKPLASQISSSDGYPMVFADLGSTLPESSRVLLVAGLQGDVLTGVSTVFAWASELESGLGQELTWRVIPVANPEGVFARPAQRTNSVGVDLNRNFPAPEWRAGKQSGPAAGSEIETRWLMDQIRQFKPDAIVMIDADPFQIGQAAVVNGSAAQASGVINGSLSYYAGVMQGIPVLRAAPKNHSYMPKPASVRQAWVELYRNLNLVLDISSNSRSETNGSS